MNNNEKIVSLTNELELMRERYLKLVDIHGKSQKQTCLLEERILSIVEIYSNERNQLEQNLINAKQQIFNLQNTVNQLEIEKQRYKDDCNLAVRLLHQNPNEFISTTSEHIQQSLKTKNELTYPNQSTHSVLIPTFPPTFVTSIPLRHVTTPSSLVINQTTTTDNLRFAESLFKSNTVHRYPSTNFVCSNCHKTIKYCDVSVQTSQIGIVPSTKSNDELNSDTGWISLEPHNHIHMTVQEYQMGNTKRPYQDVGLSSNSIPQMHHI